MRPKCLTSDTLLSIQVITLKQKIELSKPELSLAVDRQKLIHSGKVLKDDQTVASLSISESDFIVCMVSKEVAKVTDKPSHRHILFFITSIHLNGNMRIHLFL